MASFLLPCPLCSQPGFQSMDSLRDGLISAATRHVICPVCQDALPGLDKFTLHLFSHSLHQQFPTSHPPRESKPVDTVDGTTQTEETLDSVTYCGDLYGVAREQENTSAIRNYQMPVDEGCSDLTVELGRKSNCFDKIEKNLASPTQCTVDFTIQSNFTFDAPSEKVSGADDTKLGIATNFVIDKTSDENVNCHVSIAGEVESRVHGSSAPDLVIGPTSTVVRLDGAGLTTAPFEGSTCADHSSRCDTCGFCFSEQKILVMHQQLVHPESLGVATSKSRSDDRRQYSCHLCSKSFKMRGSLMVHLRVAHGGNSLGKGLAHKVDPDAAPEQRKFACPTCSKTFKKEHHLSQHVKTHEGKQWECDICCKLFTTKYFLKKHKRLHTGEMPYACGTCGKTFTFQQSYHKHLLYHSDEKPHVCQQCERAFKELSTLHNHQRIHTGEKPFACETCGKCFRQRVSYLVHRRIHTGVMPYKCSACNRSFRYKVSQRTHKCVLQTPGVLVRQPGDLVSRLQCRTQAEVSGETDGDCCLSASSVDQTARSRQATVAVGKPVPSASIMTPTTVHTSRPEGSFQEKGKEHKFLSNVEQFQGIPKGSCNVLASSNAAVTGAAGRGSLLLPVSNVSVKSFTSGGLVDCKFQSTSSSGIENPGNVLSQPALDQNTLFVETSDFFTMVMSPCLLSPSERLRYLSLSPLPAEGASVLRRPVSPACRLSMENGNGEETSGTSSKAACDIPPTSGGSGSSNEDTTAVLPIGDVDGRLQSVVGCCSSLETINEESLKQLLYGPSSS